MRRKGITTSQPTTRKECCCFKGQWYWMDKEHHQQTNTTDGGEYFPKNKNHLAKYFQVDTINPGAVDVHWSCTKEWLYVWLIQTSEWCVCVITTLLVLLCLHRAEMKLSLFAWEQNTNPIQSRFLGITFRAMECGVCAQAVINLVTNRNRWFHSWEYSRNYSGITSSKQIEDATLQRGRERVSCVRKVIVGDLAATNVTY